MFIAVGLKIEFARYVVIRGQLLTARGGHAT